MKIATMATGGIGGYLAVKLSNAGFKVATIARGDHLTAINENGLILDGPNGYEKANPWLATDSPSDIGAVDVIIFGVKCGALEAAAEACKPMLKKETIVVPFLNGVETVDRLCKILPKANIANGVARVSTTIKEPGIITPAISGATAAGRCTIGQVIKSTSLSKVFQKIISETTATARAYGINLSSSIEQDIWELVNKLPPDVRASTAVDLEKGLPLEVDWISGAVTRLAKAKGIEAPTNETIHGLLSPYKDGL